MTYFQSTVERLLYLLVVVLVITNIASLLVSFAAYERVAHVVSQNDKTTAQLKSVVTHQSETLATIKADFNQSNAHLNCIFEYFATPGRSSNTTVTLAPNQKECDVNLNPTSALGGSTGSTKSGQ